MSPEQPTRPSDIDSLPEEVQAYILYVESGREQALGVAAELKARIEEQNAQIDKLEGRVNKNSGNSNKPPLVPSRDRRCRGRRARE